jgi:hypothetical protein
MPHYDALGNNERADRRQIVVYPPYELIDVAFGNVSRDMVRNQELSDMRRKLVGVRRERVETPTQRFQVFLQLVCRECLKVRYPPIHLGGEGRFARRTL